MSLFKNHTLILELGFFIVIFVLSLQPLMDFDLWFHLKSGEIIAQKGIIHIDVFSHSASGREWFPYEWLFQVTIFYLKSWLGLESIKYLVAAFATFMVFIVYSLLRKIMNLEILSALSIGFFFFVSVYEFLSSRPQIMAYTFLLVNLYLILQYVVKNRNFLWLTLPVSILWSNLHGSIFLDVYLFGAYTIVSLLFCYVVKKNNNITIQQYNNRESGIQTVKTLGIYTFLTGLLTILPPIGFTQYRLLWIFFRNRNFISQFIDEWVPISADAFGFKVFTITLFIIAGLFAWVWVRERWIMKLGWIIPLVPMVITPYLASRNVFLAYLVLSVMLGAIFTIIFRINSGGWKKYLSLAFMVIFAAFNIFVLSDKKKTPDISYPVAGVKFIKENTLKGNMFNEYGYGGYILYNLYPDQKVFYDGRTDVYLCCEMRDTFNLAVEKNQPDGEYKKTLDRLWDKYDISYVIIGTRKHSLLRKVARILTDDPEWGLVFWDDNSQVYIRKDGKNAGTLKSFAVKAATPYNRDPFRTGTKDEALGEYRRMVEIADSAKSRNAIGYIHLKEGKIEEAQTEFFRAIKLNPADESPYMNLAEILVQKGDLDLAIKYYEKARSLAPDRGLVYLRLGQITLQQSGNLNLAKSIWREGIRNVVDDDLRKQLADLVNK